MLTHFTYLVMCIVNSTCHIKCINVLHTFRLYELNGLSFFFPYLFIYYASKYNTTRITSLTVVVGFRRMSFGGRMEMGLKVIQ